MFIYSEVEFDTMLVIKSGHSFLGISMAPIDAMSDAILLRTLASGQVIPIKMSYLRVSRNSVGSPIHRSF